MQTDNSAADPWDHSEAPPSPSVLFVECKFRKAIQNDERQAEPGTDGFIDDEFKNYLIFDGASRGAREPSAFLHLDFCSYCDRTITTIYSLRSF